MNVQPLIRINSRKRETMMGRLQYCRIMLHTHGLLTEAENHKVHQRIGKWLEKNNISLVERPAVLEL